MNPAVLEYNFGELLLKCSVYGSGSKVLLAFHGFGETMRTHERLFEHKYLSDYKVYSFALFFHESLFPEERLPESGLGKDEFSEMVYSFCEWQEIRNFSLFG